MKTNTINMVDFAQQILNAPTTYENAPESLPAVEMMESLANHYKRISNEIKRLKEQADTLKAEMIAEMDARQSEKVITESYTIRYTLRNRTTPDSEALKQDGLFEKYAKTTTYPHFEVR